VCGICGWGFKKSSISTISKTGKTAGVFSATMRCGNDAGATACIQPGGSVRDEEVIAAADAAGMAMVFTGHRHFRH
jgi:hypothetical protein